MRQTRWTKARRAGSGLVVALAVAAAAGACGSGDDDDDGGDAGSTTTASDAGTTAGDAGTTAGEGSSGSEGSEGGEALAVGDTAESGDLSVTLLSVEDPYTSSTPGDTASDGNRLVAAEVELANSATDAFAWTSMMGADLVDGEGTPFEMSFAGADLEQLDGDVPAGGTRTGWVVFEGPEDATGLRLSIQGSLAAPPAVYALG